MITVLNDFETGIPFQIQQEIKSDIFLNLQYRIAGNNLERLVITEQVMDGFAHAGNRFPADSEPWNVVDPIAMRMYSDGMKDIFAFDVAVAGEGNIPRYYALECNPRFNGSTYPSLIASELGLKRWTAIKPDTIHRSLATLDMEDLEYDPKTGTGIVIVNWGTILSGKLGVLISGEPEVQAQLQGKLWEHLR